jgi:hypothetical protein
MLDVVGPELLGVVDVDVFGILKLEGWYLPLGIVRASGIEAVGWKDEDMADVGIFRVVSEGV